MYPFFEVVKDSTTKTAFLYLNRPQKRNAMNDDFWFDLPKIVAEIEADPEIRACVVAARGKSFSTGLDIEAFFSERKEIMQGQTADAREELLKMIRDMQAGLNAIADADTIFIAAVHRHCIGGGLDLAAACDLRYCTKDASFSLREAKVAIVADMGSLQRLPSIIGQGNTRLMALTGRDFTAEAAEKMGLVNGVYDTVEEMHDDCHALAVEIAANPNIAVRGTKRILNYALNHFQKDALEHVVLYNTAFLDSLDLRELGEAFIGKRRPVFQ